MKFKITRYYIRGTKNGQEYSSVLNFRSMEDAEIWAKKVSEDRGNDFVIIEVLPMLMGQAV